MPRRDKQFRSSCHHSCCWQAAAGGSEISVLATSNSSRASGNNASTPTRLAKATREADATKRRFEYKAHLLFYRSFGPPSGAKTTPTMAGLCPRKGPGPAELETVLNGHPRRKALCLPQRWVARCAPAGFATPPDRGGVLAFPRRWQR